MMRLSRVPRRCALNDEGTRTSKDGEGHKYRSHTSEVLSGALKVGEVAY